MWAYDVVYVGCVYGVFIIYACIHTYVCIYVPIHTHVYIHACVYMHTHIGVCMVFTVPAFALGKVVCPSCLWSLAVTCCLFELGLWNAKQQQPMFRVSLLVADSLPDPALLPLILEGIGFLSQQ